MKGKLPRILHGGGKLSERARIQCIVKSTYSETRLVPALNDLLIANPSPAAVSRFRLGWLKPVPEPEVGLGSMSDPTVLPRSQYGTVTRFGGRLYDIQNSLNIWSSGMWVSTATGSRYDKSCRYKHLDFCYMMELTNVSFTIWNTALQWLLQEACLWICLPMAYNI